MRGFFSPGLPEPLIPIFLAILSLMKTHVHVHIQSSIFDTRNSMQAVSLLSHGMICSKIFQISEAVLVLSVCMYARCRGLLCIIQYT